MTNEATFIVTYKRGFPLNPIETVWAAGMVLAPILVLVVFVHFWIARRRGLLLEWPTRIRMLIALIAASLTALLIGPKLYYVHE